MHPVTLIFGLVWQLAAIIALVFVIYLLYIGHAMACPRCGESFKTQCVDRGLHRCLSCGCLFKEKE